LAADGTPFTHTFDLIGGHSAKVWEVLAPAAARQTRTLKVKITDELPLDVTLYLVRLQGGARRAGTSPLATFDHGPRGLREADVELAGQDRLYLVAVNNRAGDASMTLRVAEVRTTFDGAALNLTLEGPADVVWGDGRQEGGQWSINLLTRERLLMTSGRVFEHEVHIDKPRDEKVDLTLSATADPFMKSLNVDLVIERTFEFFDESGQDPRITGGGKQRCVVKGLVLEHEGTYEHDHAKGRSRWSYAGRIPASAIKDCSHTSQRNATRLASGDPVPHMSFTKTFKGYTGGSLTLDLFTEATPPP